MSATVKIKDYLPQPGEYLEPGQLLDRFLNYVNAKGLTLFPAQEEGILALYDGHHVIQQTPTGSGKSLVALALQYLSFAKGRRSAYTCPIKALVNEKFLMLCHEFGARNVGMITGDATVNPEAMILCCTAEILSNDALREGKNIAIDDVIMDEFHYYSDRERGVAWQVPLLIMEKTRFLLMSATLGDTSFFENSLRELTGRDCVLVSSRERPVPLEFTYRETPLHETISDLIGQSRAPLYLVNFTQRDAAEEAQNLLSTDICSKDEKKAIVAALHGTQFTSPYGKDLAKLLRHGVGIHHAGLLPKYRLLVEKLAQQGLLKVICGTDTLGVGVNVPIRTVVFTKLCKYDGEKVGILTVRDFLQIAGRAGRKGFDNVGYVVAQAPEHVIENLVMERKAASDPKKLKKLVKKKPPEKGFVMWTAETFKKLTDSQPEPLTSRFQVNHGMLLSVLGRKENGGCAAMRQLIRRSHGAAASKKAATKTAVTLFKSLLERNIIEILPSEKIADGANRIRVNVDLQEDFSLNQTLALYLHDTLSLLDPAQEDYALDVMTLAESIIENPDVILRAQISKLKTIRMAQMKMEGMEYEERMAELEKIEHPKPRRDFIYDTFNAFAAKHPWVGGDNIKPKAIAREMYASFMGFGEYIREYGLSRSEGTLLKYLSEVYRVLAQTVPQQVKTDEFNEIESYLRTMIRTVDSALIDEWERLQNPERAAAKTVEDKPVAAVTYTGDTPGFRRAVANTIFLFVRALATRDYQEAEDLLWTMSGHQLNEDDHRQAPREWTADKIEKTMDDFYTEHSEILTDRTARHPQYLRVTPDGRRWHVTQTLVDLEGFNDWALAFEVDLDASDSLVRPYVKWLGIKE